MTDAALAQASPEPLRAPVPFVAALTLLLGKSIEIRLNLGGASWTNRANRQVVCAALATAVA